jgi:glycosyltransferase involved in cell wall biosynthesis
VKILLVHNFYGSSAPSGENTVYLAERALLQQQGHEVVEFTRNSDEIRGHGLFGIVRGVLSTPWNPFTVSRLRQILAHEQPDIMHVHNTFPLLSPALFHAAAGFPTARVLTLHNYRTFCAAGIPLRRQRTCTDCLDQRSVLPALRHGCYRDSRMATLPMAAMIALHRSLGTWQQQVDAFICLSAFQKDTLAGAGLPGDKIHVKPNFYPDPPSPLPWKDRDDVVLFIGRLADYKGVRHLVKVWQEWGDAAPRLELIGDGPERVFIEESAARCDRIKLLGHLSFAETQGRLSKAKLLVLPSVCFEGFPMVIREAFALGVPVATSRLGPLPTIVPEGKVGRLFPPGDEPEMLRIIREMWSDTGNLATMGSAAHEEFEQNYTAERNYRQLQNIYRNARNQRGSATSNLSKEQDR